MARAFLSTRQALARYGPQPVGPSAIQPGDHVIINGDLGRHGMAIMTTREGFELETPLDSDSAPIWPAVKALLDAGIEIRPLFRDLTRGGLASALNELSDASGCGIHIVETLVPVEPVVQQGVCRTARLRSASRRQ